MILHCNYADEGCGLPGDAGTIGEECGKVVEGVAGNSSLSEGAVYGQEQNGHFHSRTTWLE